MILEQHRRTRVARALLVALATIIAFALVAAPQSAANEATVSDTTPVPFSSASESPADLAADVLNPSPRLGGHNVPGSNVYSGPRGVYAPSYLPECPYRHVCVAALELKGEHYNYWRVWNLYFCGNYKLYDWRERGWFNNNQTNALLLRQDADYDPILPAYGTGNRWRDINWEPAFYIETCL